MRAHPRTHRRSVRAEYLLAQEPASALQARKLTSAFLTRPGPAVADLDDERVDDAALVVSELVTNATRHGRSACRLRLQVTDDRVTVEVYDRNPAQPHIKPMTEAAESGRGLAMVRTLALHLDVAPVAGGGKTVRAVLGT